MVKAQKKAQWVSGEIPEDLVGSFLAEAIETARQHGLPESLAEDWRQEMCIAVGLRMGDYQGALSGRRTFMVRLAKWRLQELVREALRLPLGAPNRPMDSTCFPEDAGDDEEGEPCLWEIFEGAAAGDQELIDLKIDMETIASKLPEHLRRTYELLKTYSPKEAAAILGKNVDTVYAHTANLRQVFASKGIYPANMRASNRKLF